MIREILIAAGFLAFFWLVGRLEYLEHEQVEEFWKDLREKSIERIED